MLRLFGLTHPSATEGQTLSYDVDAEDLEDFLRGQRLLGHLLGISQPQCMALRQSLGCLLLAWGLGHFFPRAGWWETGNRAMPQHCQPRASRSYPRGKMWDFGQSPNNPHCKQEGFLAFEETEFCSAVRVHTKVASLACGPLLKYQGLMSSESVGSTAAVLYWTAPTQGHKHRSLFP